MFTVKNVLKAVLLIVTLCVANIWLGYKANENASKAAGQMIGSLWPHYMDLPKEDRLLIDNAAYNCQVHKEYPLPGAVRNCLRTGAMEMDAHHPEAESLKRLDILLALVAPS
jgi:hypothetical protein